MISKFLKNGLLPQSLFGRLALILIAPVLVAQLVLGYIFIDRHTESVLKVLSKTIAGDVALVVHELERGQVFEEIQKNAENHLDLKISLSSHYTLPKIGVHRDTWLYSFLSQAFDEKLKKPYFLKMNTKSIRIFVPMDRGMLEIVTPRKRFFSRTTPYVLIGSGVCGLLMLIIAFFFMRNQIRPIQNLADIADSFGRGNDSLPIVIQGAAEVRKAFIAFLTMRDRIKRHLFQRFEMLSGISHDLRTPLTRMKLQLAVLPVTPELKDLKQDVDQMHYMVEEFLTYARGYGEEKTAEVRLHSLIQDIIFPFQTDRFHITFHPIAKNFSMPLKPRLFNRCLTNVLLNSQKFATQASIRALIQNHGVEILIDDNGPSIPVDERENVFQPFYRLDVSRNLDKGGVGLGLSIVRDIIQAHGGRVSLTHVPSVSGEIDSFKGLRVAMWLPR